MITWRNCLHNGGRRYPAKARRHPRTIRNIAAYHGLRPSHMRRRPITPSRDTSPRRRQSPQAHDNSRVLLERRPLPGARRQIAPPRRNDGRPRACLLQRRIRIVQRATATRAERGPCTPVPQVVPAGLALFRHLPVPLLVLAACLLIRQPQRPVRRRQGHRIHLVRRCDYPGRNRKPCKTVPHRAYSLGRALARRPSPRPCLERARDIGRPAIEPLYRTS